MINGFDLVVTENTDQYTNVNNIDLSKIIEACDNLKSDEKAKLLKHLLGNNAGLSLVIGGTQFHADTVYQINLADKEQVSDILKAIANRIEGEAIKKPDVEN